MPATPTFPAPTTSTCPSCTGPVVDARCTTCGLALSGQLAATLWWVDTELHTLAERRAQLLPGARPLSASIDWATRTFPAPSVLVCPACDGPVRDDRCGRCGMRLDDEAAGQVWTIDTDLHRLTGQRAALLAQLRFAAAPPTAGAPRPSAATAGVGAPVPPVAAPRVGAPQRPPTGAAGPGSPVPPVAPPFGVPQPAAAGGGTRRIQTVLLALGALCLVAAVIAFGAMAWTRMGDGAKGAVLAGATVAAAAAALTAHRRGLTATAEALGVVTAVGALVDIHAVRIGLVPDAPGWQVWAIGTAVVALLAWAFDEAAPLVSARVTALAISQAPGVILALGPSWGDWSFRAGVLLLQAALTVGLLRLAGDRIRPAGLGALPIAGAGFAWTLGASIALGEVLLESSRHHTVDHRLGLAAFVAAGLVAVQVALGWERIEPLRVLASLVASAMGVLAAVLGFTLVGDVRPVWLVIALTGAVMAALGAALPARWRPAPAIVGAVAAGIGTLGGLPGLVEAMGGPGWAASGAPWRAGLADGTRSILRGWHHSVDMGDTGVLVAPTVLAALAWWRRVARPLAVGIVAAVAVALVTIVPVATGSAVWVAVGAPLLVGLVALVLAAEQPSTRVALVPVGASGLAIAAAWASVSSTATLASLGLVLAVAVAVVAAAVRRVDVEAGLGAAVVALGSAFGLGLAVPVTLGSTTARAWLPATLVLTTLSLVGWGMALLAGRAGVDDDPRGALLRRIGSVVELAAVGVHVLAIAVLADTSATLTGWVLLSGAVAFAAHATRPERRLLTWVAVAEGLAFLWVRLAIAEVALVEAYTLPLAAVVLLAGAWALRRDDERGSWETIGPGLALALVPTVAMALLDAGSARSLAAVLAGAVVLLVGIRGRLQAAVTIGALTVGTVATRQLLPAAQGLPPFVVFGVVGAVLLAVGATFEQRRRDLVDLKDRFETLR